jgi:hypothetical protein
VGFRMRKSFKIAPGVQMTATPRGVGYSAGGKGYRVSKSATGRVTRTVSVPGTGISHSSSRSASSSKRLTTASRQPPNPQLASEQPATPAPPRPGLFAPGWEKNLYRAVVAKRDPATLPNIAAGRPELQPLVAVLEAFLGALPAQDMPRTIQLLGFAFSAGFDPATHSFCKKYLSSWQCRIGITDGVTATLPLGRDLVGLALAEALQITGDLPAGIAVVEQLEPSTVAAVSLADLYSAAGRHDDVIALTEPRSTDEPIRFGVLSVP